MGTYGKMRLALTETLAADFDDLFVVVWFASESDLDSFHCSAFCIEMLVTSEEGWVFPRIELTTTVWGILEILLNRLIQCWRFPNGANEYSFYRSHSLCDILQNLCHLNTQTWFHAIPNTRWFLHPLIHKILIQFYFHAYLSENTFFWSIDLEFIYPKKDLTCIPFYPTS